LEPRTDFGPGSLRRGGRVGSTETSEFAELLSAVGTRRVEKERNAK
jgi:hypothetical protein